MSHSQLISVPHAKIFIDGYRKDVTAVTAKPYAFKVHYNANGTGRDTYINRNSGGFFKPYCPTAGPPSGSFQSRGYAVTSPSPVMKPLAVRYHSDGTGRDSYIGCTNGGLSGVFQSGDFKKNFVDSLRKSTECLRTSGTFEKRGGHSTGLVKCKSAFLTRSSLEVEKPRPDSFQESQLTFYPQHVIAMRSISSAQIARDRRLSAPKYRRI